MADQEEMYAEGAEEVFEDAGAEGEEAVEGGDVAEGDEELAEGSAEELEVLRQRLKEMEEDAARMHSASGADIATTPNSAGAPSSAAASPADIAAKQEVDARSVYIGSVDYACTPEELQQHFSQCGTVNRVTILTDKFGQPKGYAYLEFLEVDAVTNALLLDNSELHGRQIKVYPKRTNMPGMRARGRGRGRGFSPYGGRGGYSPYPPPYMGGRGRGFPPYGGYPGYIPRGRGRGRGAYYAPY